MGIVIAAGTAVSVAANSVSADQVTGTYQFLPSDGIVSLAARGSATGLNAQLAADGQTQINDQSLPYTGTAGAISQIDHEMASTSDLPAGSRIELKFRNTTGGALTVDYILSFEPTE